MYLSRWSYDSLAFGSVFSGECTGQPDIVLGVISVNRNEDTFQKDQLNGLSIIRYIEPSPFCNNIICQPLITSPIEDLYIDCLHSTGRNNWL